jgi:hypothetical protein
VKPFVQPHVGDQLPLPPPSLAATQKRCAPVTPQGAGGGTHAM